MADFEFEGDEVTDFAVQLPSTTIEASDAYTRGTLMNLNVQVRVKSVRLEEDRKGNLVRKHILAIEDVSVMDVLTPAQRKALIEAAQRAAEEEVAEQGATSSSNLIPEEEHIEDVLPGQTTIDEQIADSDDAYSPFDREDPRNHVQPGDLSATHPAGEDEDDDSEHDWMDEEEEFAHGVRVEYVGF
jgi:hypothetical protein